MAESVYIPPHLKKYFLSDSNKKFHQIDQASREIHTDITKLCDKISISENVTKPENVYNNSEHDKPMMNNKNH